MLKTEDGLVTGLAVAAVVAGIHAVSVPNVAAVRASAPGNQHADSARKSATLTAALVVVVASAVAKDPTVFVIGGVVVIALDMAQRMANSTDNQSGKLVTGETAAMVTPAAA